MAEVPESLAGAACSDTQPTPESVRKGLQLALKTFQELDRRADQVALIGRVGSDLSKHGLRYSHMGVVWRDHPKGRWFVFHMLNECGTVKSALYDEGLGNFFNDNPFAYESILVFPGAGNQDRLVRALKSALPTSLYHSGYNMLSYPWATKYQNSNQWLLEVLAASWAADGTVFNRNQAQAWLKHAGYRPTLLRLGALERLGARMFRANISFDDHPSELRFSDQIYTVTVESIADFVRRTDPEATIVELKL